MNTNQIYEQALDRLENMGLTQEQIDFCTADWNEPEHYEWLLTATKEEIVDWIQN